MLGMQISDASCAQFYIGCDSLIAAKPYGYRGSPNTLIGEMELYQDSSSNQFLLVSNLRGKKIIHRFHYELMEDLY